MSTSTCPACKAFAALGMQCNACRKSNPSARTTAQASAVRDYLANGPLGAERLAAHDAAVTAATRKDRAASKDA